LFYHNGALPGGGGFTRSICLEEFQYNEDGSILRITRTVEGVKPIEHLNPSSARKRKLSPGRRELKPNAAPTPEFMLPKSTMVILSKYAVSILRKEQEYFRLMRHRHQINQISAQLHKVIAALKRTALLMGG
jgi:hypothetical protein